MPQTRLKVAGDPLLHYTMPQSIETEESLLSAILIDDRTLLDIIEILSPEDFYHKPHRKIFDAIAELFRKNEPIDIILLRNILQEKGQLDDIGGAAYLAQLMTEMPIAVNAKHYAKIVRDKACLRRLIEKATSIATRCIENGHDVDEVIEFAENAIFEISEDKINPSFHSLSKVVHNTVDMIEARQGSRAIITGVPTGFTRLDEMTAGFQPADLIILAARPSMGKCCEASTEILLSDGSVATIEEICRRKRAELLTLNNDWKFNLTQSSDFIDDNKKPVFRVTTRLGRFVETTLTHPFLTIQGWKPLSELSAGHKIAVPRKLDVFGTEAMRECEVMLLAYLIGHGNLTNANPSFTNQNPRILADFVRATEAFGGIRAKVIRTANRSPDVSVSAAIKFAENRVKFSYFLKEQITLKGLSQNQFAKGIGVSPSAVSGWVNAKYVPSLAVLETISDFLEADLSRLIPEGYAAIAKNSKNSLVLWLEQLGLQGKNAHHKFVPAPIFRLPRDLLALFLNRLFATDGWASVLSSGQSQLGYASVSEKLIRQIQHLLLRFGVIAKIRHRRVMYADGHRSVWQLEITDADSIRVFTEDIGIFGKEDAIENVRAAITSKTYKTNTDLIPAEIWEQLARAKGSEPWTQLAKHSGIAGYSNIHVGKRSLTRKRLTALSEALNDNALQALARSEVYWDEILSISSVGKKQVYDLTIPGTHNFVANDICVHNTAFALNLARNAAYQGDVPVAVFSLEMSKEQLGMRMLCAEARVDSSRLRGGFLGDEDWERITDAAGLLNDLPIFIDDSANISVTEIRAKARRLKMNEDVGLVIIDYLQLIKGRSSAERRDLEIAEISRSLKALAKELELPVIALSQLNRKLEERGDKRPVLSDLRESGSLEQDADVVAFIYRDEVYNKDEANPNRGKAEVIIGKQRNGPIGVVHLAFLNIYTRFENLAPEHFND